jgi:TolA-binding protein
VRESHGGSARAQAAPPQASPPAAAPPPSGPSRQERYEAAARLEGRDPERALAGYRQLAAEGGPWAANALYAEARLELELGRTARARRLLRRYLDRFPDGLNAEDARSLLEGR